MKCFDTLGVMLDCSRNAVLKVEELKRLISLLHKMGYNQIQLYTEDTYEVDGEPYFGYFRGRYTQKELREIDDYAYELGVELVPCIQTLAHLNQAMRWKNYQEISEISDILMVGDERTYKLIECMIASLRKCFRTNKIHIGMDEAHMLGRGKYLDIHGLCDRSKILLEHLQSVCRILDKYHYEPMMWGDMFYRIANGGNYYGTDVVFDPSIKEKIPSNVRLIYWDYYHTEKSDYHRMAEGYKQLTDQLIFAGGAWKWDCFAPHNQFSIQAVEAAFEVCAEHGIRDVLITLWGDDGAEASVYSILPTLCYGACFAQGIKEKKDIAEKFKEWVGCELEEFMLLELPDQVISSDKIINSSKYELYQDCFMGIFDDNVSIEESGRYAAFAEQLKNVSANMGYYTYLFDAASKLCELLSYKSVIGIRTREAYIKDDKNELKALIADYETMITLADQFYDLFKCQWHRENKPFGFEVQEIRLGGLMLRMRSCKERLQDYVDGKILSIPELNEKVLPLDEIVLDENHSNFWRNIVTVNAL